MEFNPFIRAWVASQLRSVNDFDPRIKGGFLCPRTLEYAGNILSAYDNDSDNPDCKAALHGCIGDNYASQCLAFIETATSLPTWDNIISDPLAANVEVSMASAIAKTVAANCKYAHVPKVLRYIKRYPVEQQAMFLTLFNDTLKSHVDVMTLSASLGFTAT